MTKHFSELEFKDADPADPVELVTKSLDDLSKSVETRLKDIETKSNDRLDKIEAKMQRPSGGAKSTDESKELETKALNAFFRGGVTALDDLERKTLVVGTPASGGYVTAPEYSTTIIEKIQQISPIRQLASVMTVGASKVYLPLLDDRLAAAWVTETGTRASSEPTFDQLEIDPYEAAVIVPVSQQLLEDSFVDLSGYLATQIATQFAKLESTAFMVGDGSGKPTGLLHTPANYDAVTAKQDASDIIDKVIALFYSLPGAYASNGSWMMNRAMQGIIRAAADNTTKGNLWSDSLANGTPATLLGRPVYESVDMDNLAGTGSPAATTYPVAFGDFAKAYQIIDRVGVQIMRDDYTGADNGIVKFRARKRTGGKPVLTEALVLLKATVSGS
ncbi:MAG TPA: phage major capsid protein [Nitrobacter sp.]|nr:phage major capsid protein [Nitrobacter sp.]